MAAPEKVRLKRKRHDDPLEALILTKADVDGVSTSDYTPLKRIRYKLVDNPQPAAAVLSKADSVRSVSPSKKTAHRLFHLRRWPLRTRQDRGNTASQTLLPTFEERDASQQQRQYHNGRDEHMVDVDEHSHATPTQSHKRPGKGSTLGRSKDVMQDVASHKAKSAAEHQHNMQALADLLHEAALEDLASVPKPTSRAKPKMSPRQAKERHDRNVASREGSPLDHNAQMTDVTDFVYDTYILAPADDLEEVAGSNVGYLVIGKDDEDVWQSYMDEAQAAEEEEKDEDDENAESYYAADYPEDEDDSEDDDAFGIIHKSTGQHNEEEWDHREDEWTEDEATLSEGPSIRNATVVRKWEKILCGDAANDS